MLISLAEELGTSVNVLLGESVEDKTLNDDVDIKTIAERLEVINLQLARRSEMKIKLVRWILILLCIVIVAVFIAFGIMPQLLSIADEIEILHASCNECNRDAIYTYYDGKKKGDILVGNDNYIALCARCLRRKKNER